MAVANTWNMAILHTFLNLTRTSIFSSHPIFNKSTCSLIVFGWYSHLKLFSLRHYIFSWFISSTSLIHSICLLRYDSSIIKIFLRNFVILSSHPCWLLQPKYHSCLCPSLQDADMSHCELSPPLQFLLPRDIQWQKHSASFLPPLSCTVSKCLISSCSLAVPWLFVPAWSTWPAL